VAMVHPRVFDGTGYVALGHLHGRQRITDTVRYSGSPVAMSFSEATHTKGSWLVDLDTAGVRVQQVEAPVLRPLAVLRGDLSHLLEHAAYVKAERSWCQVTLTDPVRPLGAMEKIRRRFPHTLSLLFDPQGAPVPVSSYAARLAQKSDVDVCCDFLSHVRSGQAAEPAEREVLAEAVEAVRLRRAGRDDEGSVSAASTGVAERRGVA